VWGGGSCGLLALVRGAHSTYEWQDLPSAVRHGEHRLCLLSRHPLTEVDNAQLKGVEPEMVETEGWKPNESAGGSVHAFGINIRS
jgi:hypothetical protein